MNLSTYELLKKCEKNLREQILNNHLLFQTQIHNLLENGFDEEDYFTLGNETIPEQFLLSSKEVQALLSHLESIHTIENLEDFLSSGSEVIYFFTLPHTLEEQLYQLSKIPSHIDMMSEEEAIQLLSEFQ